MRKNEINRTCMAVREREREREQENRENLFCFWCGKWVLCREKKRYK